MNERLSIAQVREELGGVSRITVWRLMRDGKLGYVQVSGHVRQVLRSQLDNYLASKTVPGKLDKLPTFLPSFAMKQRDAKSHGLKRNETGTSRK